MQESVQDGAWPTHRPSGYWGKTEAGRGQRGDSCCNLSARVMRPDQSRLVGMIGSRGREQKEADSRDVVWALGEHLCPAGPTSQSLFSFFKNPQSLSKIGKFHTDLSSNAFLTFLQ